MNAPIPMVTDGMPTDGASDTAEPAPEPPVDRDGDGFTADVDCDDSSQAVYPGAPEWCDGVDNDCDDGVDAAVVTWWPLVGEPRNLEDLATAGATIDGGTVVVCPGRFELGPGLVLSGVVDLRGRDPATELPPTATLSGSLVADPGADIVINHLVLTADQGALIRSSGASWQLEWMRIENAEVEDLISVDGAERFRLLNTVVADNQAVRELIHVEGDTVEVFGTQVERNVGPGPVLHLVAAEAAQSDGLALVGNDHGVRVVGGDVRWFEFSSREQGGGGPALGFLNPLGGVVWGVEVEGTPGVGLSVGWNTLGAATLELREATLRGNQRGLAIDAGPGAATVQGEDLELRDNGDGTQRGAGLAVEGEYASVYLTNTQIVGNRGADAGGAWAKDAVLVLERSVVQGNEGGGVDLDGASLLYVDVDFGAGPTDNQPHDVRHAAGGTRSDLTSGASGACTEEGC